MKLLHATKRSKRLQWDACSKEIHRLNRKLEFYEGTADLIDPQDLKKSVEEIMSKSDRHTRAAHVKRKRSVDSIGKGDDVDCFDYDDVRIIGKEASHIAEGVAQAEQEGDSVGQDEDEETGGEYKEEEMEDREHEEKEEDREQALSEGDREQENREEDREQVVVEQEDSLQENKLVDSSASEKVEVREEYFEVEVREQEMKVHEKEEELAQMFEEEKEEEKGSAEKVEEMGMGEKNSLQVYRKWSKKVVSKGTRGPSTRIRTRSQLIRTPFTEEKKKIAQPELITISHHKEDVREKIRYYCKPSECTWDFQKTKKIKKKEEALLKVLNERIPFVDDFSIRLVDSAGTFVHNFRIPHHVAAKLTLEENRWVSEFCNQKAHE